MHVTLERPFRGRGPRGGIIVKRWTLFVVLVCLLISIGATAGAWTPQPVKQDPLVFMPGSQPGDVAGMDNATRCENCHSGYNAAVEPGSNWRGSMMAQAARDPLWLACLTVGAQDAIWAVGTPNATDICIRCHAPGGWLAGRSDPTNTSALVGNDFEGVECDFCHRKIDPFATNGQADVPAETPGSLGDTSAQLTLNQNIADLGLLTLLDGSPFLSQSTLLPAWYGPFPAYAENGGGQYYVAASSGAKYGPYFDAVGRHQQFYSRYHKSKEFCHTCHDVSNPILENALDDPSGSTKFAAASYFHVERTSSEFLLSDYGSGGSPTAIAAVPFANKCQDCHLRDVTGKGCNKADTPLRTDLPLHDMTGGNTWVSAMLASADTAWTGYDAYNHAILSGAKYPGASIDVAGLLGLGDELDRGVKRANDQLKIAASLSEVTSDTTSVTIRVRNNTGHKLISGFPEGRRMFLNVKWYDDAGTLVSEVNPYAPLVKQTVGGNDVYVSGGDITSKTDELVWEAEMSSALTGEDKSFHFALATSRFKDNRIPPKGFRIAQADARITQPVIHGVVDPGYFTAAEYAGGYDDVTLTIPAGASRYVATLYYQTTSKDYIAFLRDEIKGTGNLTLSGTGAGGDAPYLAQSDPFFANLRGWGDAIWDLWVHNGGAAPIEMAVLGAAPQPPTPITVGPPTGTKANYSNKTKAATVTWVAPSTGANGYQVFRSTTSGGAYTQIGEVGSGATLQFLDSGPFSPGTYYYVVKAYRVDKTGLTYTSAYSTEASMRVR